MDKNYPSMRNVRKPRPTRRTSAFNCVKLTDDTADMDDNNYPTEPVKQGLAESVKQEAIYKHKTYCPLYKHKDTCPAVLILKDMNHKGLKKSDDPEDPAEASTGLPRLKLGPCPIIGRPCTKSNAFSKLLKNVEPPLPPSHSDAGKICCSKELERIKKMLKEFTSVKKDDDFRCVNKFFRDGRCCDDDQTICALKGEACCGIHKLNLKPRKTKLRKK